MNRYHQRIEAIRLRYRLELAKKRLWHADLLRAHEADVGHRITDAQWSKMFANCPDQLLVNIYAKAVRKLRAERRAA